MIARSIWLALTLVPSLLPVAHAAAAPETGAFGAIARAGVEKGLTAGISIAVVRGGRVLWQEALGEADLETHRPVRPDTRFYIASTSKALTGLAAARLADRGVIDLSGPLSRALPMLRLPEGLSPDSVTVLDLLTHTHGLGAVGPITLRMSFTGEFTNPALLGMARLHGLARGGRAYQYSNVGYELVGILMAPDEERGWKGVVEREVTAPLGMTRTTSFRSRLTDLEIAMPHEMGAERLQRVRLAKDDANLGPAGGHFSTAGDLARLLIAELGRGVVDGRQAVPARVIATSQAPHASQDRDFGAYHRHGWGIGWDLGTYEGDTLLHRFGGFAGYYSHVSFMPGRGVGVVVLVNGGSVAGRLADAVANGIYDRLIGRADAVERSARALEAAVEHAAGERTAVAEDLAKRAARPKAPPLPLAAYAGTYSSEAFGTLVLEARDGVLEAAMGVARSAVEVFDADQDQLRVTLLGFPSVMTAAPGPGGRVEVVQLLGETFERRAP
jgi:CubicO group peptidase (beta-lactamase class C family)